MSDKSYSTRAAGFGGVPSGCCSQAESASSLDSWRTVRSSGPLNSRARDHGIANMAGTASAPGRHAALHPYNAPVSGPRDLSVGCREVNLTITRLSPSLCFELNRLDQGTLPLSMFVFLKSFLWKDVTYRCCQRCMHLPPMQVGRVAR
jgi:hypothetical protein